MKNLKKVLAFTLALAMVLSTMTTTFAASKEVEALANLKLLLNTTDAEVNQELTRSVGLAMVLKALGYAQADADAKMGANTFVDMEAAKWAKGYAALAEELKISNGTSVEPKLFSPLQKLDEKSFVTFMLRALGYDSAKAWSEAEALSKEAGLTKGEFAKGAFSKGSAAVVMYNALLAKVQGDKKGRTLAEKLVDEKKLDKDLAVANGLMSAEPEKLEVKEVKADNLKEVTVMFNGTAEKDSAEKVGNYKIQNAVVTEAKILEGGKSVLLTVKDHLVNKKETKLTVTNVKTVAGKAMDKQVVMFTPKDVQYPEVKDVTFTGPRNLEITFSEPINFEKSKTAKVLLKLEKSTLTTSVTKSEKSNVLNVKLNTALKDGKEYMVIVGDAKDSSKYVYDYAGYPNIFFEGNYTYNADKNAPEAKVVKADQKVVELEFTKPVKGLTKDHFYHSFSSYKAYELFNNAEMKDAHKVKSSDSVAKVWIQFYAGKDKGHAIPGGTTEMVVLSKAGSHTIKDNWGNAFATTAYKLEITADREAPEVVSAEVTGEDEIKVTFSEKMTDITKRSAYTLLDKDGKEVEKYSNLKVTSDGDKVAKLKLSKSYAGKTLTLNVKGLKDASLYQNTMNDYSSSIEFVDKTWKGVTSVELKRDGNTQDTYKYTLLVTFDEDMDDSAIDVANYKFLKDGKTASIKGTADFFEGKNSIVQFDLTYDSTKTDTDIYFLIGNQGTIQGASIPELILNDKIKDTAGNTMKTFQTAYKIKNFDGNAGAPVIEKVELVEHRKVVVKFNKDLTNVDTSAFVIRDAASTNIYTTDATYDVKDGKTIEINLADNKTLGTVPPAGVKLYFTQNNGTYDIYGRKPANVEKDLEDKAAPAIAEVDKSATDKTKVPNVVLATATELGTANAKGTVEITYTEAILNNSVSTNTYRVSNDWKLDSVNVADKKVTLNLSKDKGKLDELKDLTVYQVAAVTDNKGNRSNYDSSMGMQVIDKVAVVLTDAEKVLIAKGKLSQVKFNELVLTNANHNTEDYAKAAVLAKAKELAGADVNVEITDGAFTAAVVGNTDGTYKFKVQITSNAVNDKTDFITLTIAK